MSSISPPDGRIREPARHADGVFERRVVRIEGGGPSSSPERIAAHLRSAAVDGDARPAFRLAAAQLCGQREPSGARARAPRPRACTDAEWRAARPAPTPRRPAARPLRSSCLGIRNCRAMAIFSWSRYPVRCTTSIRSRSASGTRRQRVGGRDEQDLREVVVDLEVVVVEGAVLLGVEDLQQCGGRDRPGSPARACRSRRAASTGLTTSARRMAWMIAPGQGADVGAPVAANLRFVPNAAEGHASESCGRALGRSTGRATSCRRRAARRGRGSGRPGDRRAPGRR